MSEVSSKEDKENITVIQTDVVPQQQQIEKEVKKPSPSLLTMQDKNDDSVEEKERKYDSNDEAINSKKEHSPLITEEMVEKVHVYQSGEKIRSEQNRRKEHGIVNDDLFEKEETTYTQMETMEELMERNINQQRQDAEISLEEQTIYSQTPQMENEDGRMKYKMTKNKLMYNLINLVLTLVGELFFFVYELTIGKVFKFIHKQYRKASNKTMEDILTDYRERLVAMSDSEQETREQEEDYPQYGQITEYNVEHRFMEGDPSTEEQESEYDDNEMERIKQEMQIRETIQISSMVEQLHKMEEQTRRENEQEDRIVMESLRQYERDNERRKMKQQLNEDQKIEEDPEEEEEVPTGTNIQSNLSDIE